MSNEVICTRFELQQFACSDVTPTAGNFHSFIDYKSKGKYAVVEQEFITELLDVSNEQINLTTNLTSRINKLRKKWSIIISRLKPNQNFKEREEVTYIDNIDDASYLSIFSAKTMLFTALFIFLILYLIKKM